MKSLFSLIIFLAFTASAFGQANPERETYRLKYEKFSKMKTTGTVLTLVGSVVSVVGYATMINAQGDLYTEIDQGKFNRGLAMYVLGSLGAGAGVPLWIVGGINKGRYERKLESASLRLNLNRQAAGLSVSVKF